MQNDEREGLQRMILVSFHVWKQLGYLGKVCWEIKLEETNFSQK